MEAIARQTNRDFTLYVFDDCSPEPVEAIVREFSDRVPLQFHRFPENLGRQSLARHWERCLRLTQEPWIWLFSDDDTMDPGCVADFLAERERTRSGHDAYRFDTDMIDGAGVVIRPATPNPAEEYGPAFLLDRWREARTNCLQELIFSRDAWQALGGIPDYPLGWHSDDALTARLAVRRPVRRIEGSKIHWRWSGANISTGGRGPSVARLIRASSEFLPWAVAFIREHDAASAAEARRLSERWFFKFLSGNWKFLGMDSCLAIEGLTRGTWGHWPGWGLLAAMGSNVKVFGLKCKGAMRRLQPRPAK